MAACDYLGFNIFFWNYQNYWNDLCKFDTPDISYDDFLTGMSMTYATAHPKQQLFNDYSTQLYNYCLSGSSSAHGHTDIYYWSGNTDGSTSNTGLTGTKVGIGTDSPSYLLDVAGSARVTASLYVSDISSDASYLQFWNNKMRIDAGGNISIGASATGNEKLTVTGNISASTSIFAPIISATTGIINGNLGVSGRTLLGTIDAAGASYSQDKILVAQSDGEIEYLTTAQLSDDLTIDSYWSGSTDQANAIVNSGMTFTKVGIGTTEPLKPLTVSGDISGSTALYLGNHTNFISGETSTSGDLTLHSGDDIELYAGDDIVLNTDCRVKFTYLTGTTAPHLHPGIEFSLDDSPGNCLILNGQENTVIAVTSADTRLYFNDIGGEYIVGDGTDLTIASGADIILTPTVNVGIGTSVPNEKLTVVGNVSASTSIFAPIISGTTALVNGNLGVSGRTLLGTIDAAGASYSTDKILVAQSNGEVEYLTKAQLQEDISAGYWSANTDGSISTSGNSNIQLADNTRLKFGAGDDLQIYSDSTNGRIAAGSGLLQIEGDAIDFTDGNATEYYIRCVANGAVSLYHDANEKIVTTPTGINVTGNLTASTALFAPIITGTTAMIEGNLGVSGNSIVTGDLTTDGILYTDDIRRLTDNSTSTRIQLGGNNLYIYAGSATNAHVNFRSTFGTVFNDGGQATYDFRVEGDTDTHLIFADAGTDKVGIGTTAANEKLTVVGNISASTSIFSPIISGTTALVNGNLGVSGRTLLGTIDAAGASYSTDKILVAQSNGEVEYLTKAQLSDDLTIDSYWSGSTDQANAIVNSGMTFTKVGIGTTEPLKPLTVSGDISGSTALYLGRYDCFISGETVPNADLSLHCGDDIELYAGDDIVLNATEKIKFTRLTGGTDQHGPANMPSLQFDLDDVLGTVFIENGEDDEVIAIHSGDSRLYFKDIGGEYIVSDGTDLTIASGADILLTATTNVGIGTTIPRTKLDVHHDPTSLGNDRGGGEVVTFGSNTSGMVAGKLYYLNASGAWALTDADATSTGASQLLGIGLGTSASAGVLLRGFFDMTTYLSGTFTSGIPVYVSFSAGYITVTQPTGTNDFVRVVGYCTDTPNVIYFNPDGTYIKLA